MELQPYYDVIVIGGGINGCGIAADASGRGLSVLLCEQNDLASATSSMSSKLIHGGLRYLEQFEFKLVHESLKEQSILLRAAPHIVKPLPFILPYHKNLKPYWILRMGLWLYDYLYSSKIIPRSKAIKLNQHEYLNILKPQFQKGFLYYDCQTDDARLVIENALLAQSLGATILTRHKVISSQGNENLWTVSIIDKNTNTKYQSQCRILVNASGPWVNQSLDLWRLPQKQNIQLVKGSHITLPKLYDGNFAFTLQTSDRRVIFTIPYLKDYTLIGTTEKLYNGDPHDVKIDVDEISYLCQEIERYFQKPVSPKQSIWNYSGVRPLSSPTNENLSHISRDYMLDFTKLGAHALLSVYGGKITTYRSLAEKAVNHFKPFFTHQKDAWTEKFILPGGHGNGFKNNFTELKKQYHFISDCTLTRYISTYGSRTEKLLENISNQKDLGLEFAQGFYQHEVDFLIKNEWAKTAEDILWRRTKVGMLSNNFNIDELEQYIHKTTYINGFIK